MSCLSFGGAPLVIPYSHSMRRGSVFAVAAVSDGSLMAAIGLQPRRKRRRKSASQFHSRSRSPGISENLKGTIAGLNVILAGSDAIGDNITFKGTTNAIGSQMSLSYVLNAGASGRCETDNGTGILSK